jgi:choline-glycine betaine transporter
VLKMADAIFKLIFILYTRSSFNHSIHFFLILSDKTWGITGHIIDIIAVLATIFGLATSLGFGAQQAASGLNFLFGFKAGIGLQVTIIIACVTAVAIISKEEQFVSFLSPIM